MFVGHFGVAAAVKAAEPRVPLWSLMLATQFLDVIFIGLYMAGGVESFRAVTSGTYGEALIDAGYTHSLLGALLLSALYGGVAAWRWGRKPGLVLGALVFSHWLLDLLVHRADLPLLPGNAGDLPLLGLGLWQTPWATAVIEGVLLAAGAVLYFRSVRRRATDTRRALVAGAVMSLLLVAGLAVDVLS
ncbi:permease [Spongiactinospora rosea]|uniref:Permease n=1 Tax=Spongiactinospora rosea TaxID=2248750 RepID=A0A366LJK7_9ACTN|nr:permease [Spongiactinospora rosea]RBQ14066.1 permease [Spongiactinospora rosea]